MGLGTLIAGIDDAISADPSELADRDTIVELHRQLARLEAAVTRATAAFDAGQAWQADGARTAAAWLSVRCSLPQATARRRVWLGRALRHLPASEEAWTAGNLTGSHVGLLAAARTPATEEVLARDEDLLVGQAKVLRFGSFAKVVAYWSWRADPDGAERSDEHKRDSRRFHLSRTWGDMWAGDFMLDPISGTIVSNVVKRIDRELFEADWAEARVSQPTSTLNSGAGRLPSFSPGGWTGPSSSGWCSTRRLGSSTWAWPDGCSRAPPVGPWRCGTATARGPFARSGSRNARSTTPSPGPKAGRRHRTTAGWPAASTTGPPRSEDRRAIPEAGPDFANDTSYVLLGAQTDTRHGPWALRSDADRLGALVKR